MGLEWVWAHSRGEQGSEAVRSQGQGHEKVSEWVSRTWRLGPGTQEGGEPGLTAKTGWEGQRWSQGPRSGPHKGLGLGPASLLRSQAGEGEHPQPCPSQVMGPVPTGWGWAGGRSSLTSGGEVALGGERVGASTLTMGWVGWGRRVPPLTREGGPSFPGGERVVGARAGNYTHHRLPPGPCHSA